jgi:zinc transport system substrate-binding protein
MQTVDCVTPLATSLVVAPAVAGSAQAAAKLGASMKPVHSLVSAVMDRVKKPRMLVEAGQAPHTYSLAPSDTGALE